MGKGLFDYGDIDGGAATARLQQPLGIASADGLLYIADTYNHRIKTYSLETAEIHTIAGTGTP